MGTLYNYYYCLAGGNTNSRYGYEGDDTIIQSLFNGDENQFTINDYENISTDNNIGNQDATTDEDIYLYARFHFDFDDVLNSLDDIKEAVVYWRGHAYHDVEEGSDCSLYVYDIGDGYNVYDTGNGHTTLTATKTSDFDDWFQPNSPWDIRYGVYNTEHFEVIGAFLDGYYTYVRLKLENTKELYFTPEGHLTFSGDKKKIFYQKSDTYYR